MESVPYRPVLQTSRRVNGDVIDIGAALEFLHLACTGDVSKYEIMIKIGEGTYGEVYKARNRETHKVVALKKVSLEGTLKESVVTSLVREAKILNRLQCENVVRLIEICKSTASYNSPVGSFYLVLEFCEHDLSGLLGNNVKFTLGEVKNILRQLFCALYFVHKNGHMHRDLKTSNILITQSGMLKLADFGLSRELNQSCHFRGYTTPIVTLWYRSPELILGDCFYGPPIDMWAAGCVMGEMFKRSAILKGSTEQGQLRRIINLCGSINEDVWPGVEKLQLNLYKKMEFPKNEPRRLMEYMQAHVSDSHALDLLDKLLVLDPNCRIDADKALSHPFFYAEPKICSLDTVLSKYSRSMFTYHVQRKQTTAKNNNTREPRTRKLYEDGQYFDRVF